MFGLSEILAAALISSVTTISVAVVGFLVAFGRLAHEAKISREAAARIERIKLNTKIYEQAVLPAVSKCIDAEVGLSTFIRLFESAMQTYRMVTSQGRQSIKPKARIPTLIELKSQLDRAAIEFITFAESWYVIDSRLDIFKLAISAARHDIDEVYGLYFQVALKHMPFDMPDGTIFWNEPTTDIEGVLKEVVEKLLDQLTTLSTYVSDFRTEMQNILLSELFQHRAPIRSPIDPKYVVITLTNHALLTAHFEKDTSWGRNKRDIEAQARANLQK